ncbi:ABC-2 type transport system permease protein [Streptosporangium becharense]|uniref:Transport permease protein n=1 Tax=Streptosporangium becharense TaxID=1816182 RepID=A0A7W9MKA4_9ACTN|nr:ABC transporter permease [Streptosporangium becharense]MBB2910546.1 ABC-2 type transport system permease protein [Streptosporangium becharense]MBB5823289.1 ABC-2 type transport system permease protein [Streptosporangium becharense]
MTASTIAAPAAPRGHAHTARGYARTFGALLARDLRVMRRGLLSFVARTVLQPVLFIFVFAVVLPAIGYGAGGPAPGGQTETFATILVPGLVASGIVLQGIFAVTTPLVMELSYTREIDDRALAPIPVWAVGVEKIVAGAVQGVVAAVVVFLAVLFVHGPGQAPDLDFGRWPLLVAVLVLSSLLTACLGLLIGTVLPPQQLSTLFAIFIVPLMMLGCVYYPWDALDALPWLQITVLANPLVYVSEALRGALSPGVPHMSEVVALAVLVVGTLVTGALSLWSFTRRLVA